MDKYTVVTTFQKRLLNPVLRSLLLRGIPLPGVALLETIGRVSGQPRYTPVGDGTDGDRFWIITEHGHRADYVRNIGANPRVRVRIGDTWRSGTARVTGEAPADRARILGRSNLNRRLNDAIVRAVGTEMLTIRVDLEP